MDRKINRLMPKRIRVLLILTTVMALLLFAIGSVSADGPSRHQHGEDEGHLFGTGAFGNIAFVSKLEVTEIEGLVADVAVSPDGKWAFLANWGVPDCAGPETGGQTSPDAGAWVINIENPANPVLTGFIAHHQDSRPGEGMQVIEVTTKFFSGNMLVMNNEQCGKNGKGGVSLWDVTNPLNPRKLSEHWGDRNQADTNDIHSAFAWDAGDNAYVVIVDNFETGDVDILDITNPKRPRMIAEYNLDVDPGDIDQPELGLSESFLHDMVVKQIGDRFIMLLSYWDGGYVKLDVTDPANAEFLGDTDFNNPDPELLESAGIELPPEGNGHQNEFTKDNNFFIGTDEDFSPYRASFRITTGPNADLYPAGEFGWTVPIASLPGQTVKGPVVYGGYGCPQDAALIPSPSVLDPYLTDPDDQRILVLQRGPVGDPSANFDACFFSEKVEAAQNAGYDAVIISNHHVGAGGSEDGGQAFLCGSQGHVFTPAIPGVCIGHETFHLLFNSTPAYDVPYVAGNEPPIGTVGEHIQINTEFDGWGYVHLFDANSMEELDTYAIPEAHDPAYASGFGDLTVHEVATDKTYNDRAYLSYYAGGLRALQIQGTELVETGGYLDPEGNNFWGVETYVGEDGETYILGSDRDSGLWIFRRTD